MVDDGDGNDDDDDDEEEEDEDDDDDDDDEDEDEDEDAAGADDADDYYYYDDDDSKDISRLRGQFLTRCHAGDLTKHRSDWMFARKWHIYLWSFEDAQQ